MIMITINIIFCSRQKLLRLECYMYLGKMLQSFQWLLLVKPTDGRYVYIILLFPLHILNISGLFIFLTYNKCMNTVIELKGTVKFSSTVLRGFFVIRRLRRWWFQLLRMLNPCGFRNLVLIK